MTIELCGMDEEGKFTLTPDSQYKLHSSFAPDMSYTEDTIDRLYEYEWKQEIIFPIKKLNSK